MHRTGWTLGETISSNEQLAACAVSVKGTYDPVTSLADLRHFDSLQVLYISNKMGASPITDLTGLEECKNLMLLSVPSVESSAFPTFAKLDSVVELKYAWRDPDRFQCLRSFGAGADEVTEDAVDHRQ